MVSYGGRFEIRPEMNFGRPLKLGSPGAGLRLFLGPGFYRGNIPPPRFPRFRPLETTGEGGTQSFGIREKPRKGAHFWGGGNSFLLKNSGAVAYVAV